MKFTKQIILVLFVATLVSCGAYQYTTATKESNEATKEQQEQVKQEVLTLITDEYKQPFKLENFSYKYERHWVDNTCQMSFCKMEKYGTYSFKIKAIDNPIIVMNFKINDGGSTKESIKPLIDSFKKTQLMDAFCVGLWHHYKDNKISLNSKLTRQELQANDYCNDRAQTQDYDNIYTRY